MLGPMRLATWNVNSLKMRMPRLLELLEAHRPDLAFLQDLYRRVNQEGHARAGVRCPSCDTEFTVDLAGGRPGES